MKDDLNPGQNGTSTSGKSSDWLTEALDDIATFRNADAQSPAVAPGHVTLVGPDSCPEPGAWLRLILDGVPQSETEKLLAHAAMCANCLARLRQSRLALNEEVSAEESVEMNRFTSVSNHWQRQLAARLAVTPRPGAVKRIPGLVWWAAAGLAATLLLIFSFDAWWHYRHSPERLLAQAYTEDRTFDLRIPGAGFAVVQPAHQLRDDATDNESPSLLTARAILKGKLERHPKDPELLHLGARADLLEQKYDAAIDVLDRLLANGPVTASLLQDDASAYFQRGLATGNLNDRATALENLRRADQLAPEDPVVLFNEALVMEDRGLLSDAADVWNRYLKVEHDPKWLAEGQRRLSHVQAQMDLLKSHQSRIEQHPATPRAMRALAANTARAGRSG
ncbi:MAG TPA: hypothetical protein VMV57_11245 [Terracidiphilus sp.]|nr:hypothetical protein [Terracidiphilus sp.]